MTANHLRTFGGLPVEDVPGAGEPWPGTAELYAWRVRVLHDGETWSERFARFLDEVDGSAVRALLVGDWNAEYGDDSREAVAAIAAAADRLPNLTALFVGDIAYEECELSMIEHDDLTALLTAYPRLEELGVRGSWAFIAPYLRHTRLRALTVEGCGLLDEMVRGIADGEFPALTRVELWFGDHEYAVDAVTEVTGLLRSHGLPALTHLGLRNCDRTDALAAALAVEPLTAQLRTIDLSMGTLSDAGAEALLSGQPLGHLEFLDLTHHFLSKTMIKRLEAALPVGKLAKAETDPIINARFIEVRE